MKRNKLLAGGILLIGTAISLHNSATNTLSPNVAAQSDDTSSNNISVATISNDKSYTYNHRLRQDTKISTLKSDNDGMITTIPGISIHNCKANTLYKITYTVNTCEYAPNEMFDNSLKGITTVTSIIELDKTNVDTKKLE